VIEFEAAAPAVTAEQLLAVSDQDLTELHADLYGFLALVQSEQARRQGFHAHTSEGRS
jgi:hypothetical protein